MARKRPEGRLDQLLDCATRVFIEKGYRRTQMADVAREMGVSAGTLYGYVESKEALFHLLVDRAFTGEAAVAPELPVRTPRAGATVGRLRERLASEAALPRLAAAAARPRARDVRRECEDVLGELYDLVARTQAGSALIERSALDLPDLVPAFYLEMRRDLLARLTRWLERRIQSGQLRRVPDTALAARLVVETITWFARHRLRDRDTPPIDDALARTATLDFLIAGLLPQPRQRPRP
ncbi:TetR/AcrR family transcriptional regulator [Candidatus Binatia bacterium]|jgi:AcrR family transcriptional regulator|nr:TetR/AcrR family transcriptional regulator [Candidatus Binatia bacterium]